MNTVTIILLLVTCAAVWRLLAVFKAIAQSWVTTKKIKRAGIEAAAWILQVHCTDETARSIPYVKLLLEVHPPEGGHFITEISSVFSVTESAQLKAGRCLKVKYEPGNREAVVLQKNHSTASGKTTVIHKQLLPKPALVMAR